MTWKLCTVGRGRSFFKFSFNFKWKENERKAKAITITKPIRFIALLLRFLILENTARKPSNCEKRKRKMFNKILFIIIYSNITIPIEKIFLWTICAFEFSYNLNTLLVVAIIQSFVFPFHFVWIAGSSMRSLPSQHRGLYSRQRIQLEELADDTSAGSPYFGPVAVWAQSQEGKTNGAPDKKPTSVETVRLPRWRRVSRVSRPLFRYIIRLNESFPS